MPFCLALPNVVVKLLPPTRDIGGSFLFSTCGFGASVFFTTYGFGDKFSLYYLRVSGQVSSLLLASSGTSSSLPLASSVVLTPSDISSADRYCLPPSSVVQPPFDISSAARKTPSLCRAIPLFRPAKPPRFTCRGRGGGGMRLSIFSLNAPFSDKSGVGEGEFL